MTRIAVALTVLAVAVSTCLAAGFGRSGASFTASRANGGNAFAAGDWVAPAVTLTRPAPGARLGTATPALSGAAGMAAGDLATVTVRIYSGLGTGGAVAQVLTATAAGGSWSATPATALPDGTYTAQASQDDAAGNSGTSAPASFTIDTTAPAPTVAAPSGYVGVATPALSGTAGNATGDAASVSVVIRQGATVVQTLTPARAGTSWTATPSALPEGTYTTTVTQTDDLGHSGTSAPRSFTVDLTGPSLTLAAPAPGSATQSRTPAFSGAAGTATGDLSQVVVKVYAGAGTGGAVVQTLTPTAAGATWSATPASLADGVYTVQATQSDQAGNATLSAAVTFAVDNVAPAPTVSTPSGSVATTTPTLSGTAGTATGDDATVKVEILSGASVVQTQTVARSGASWSTTPFPALGQGTYTVRVTQGDWAANSATSSSVSFTVDTVAPAAPAVTAPSVWATSTTPTISGTAANGAGDDTTVTVEILSGATIVQTLSAPRSGTTWSVAVPSALTEGGAYTVRARQGDAAGNTSANSAALAFTIDSVAPAVTLTLPATGTYTNSTTPTFSGAAGTATADLSTITVRVYNAGGTVVQTRTATASAGAWSVAATALAEGTYTVAASQSDSAGNTGTSATSTFTVDTTAPTAASVTTTNVAGGTAGALDAGDTLTFTYSEAMDPASIVTGWNGTGSQPLTLTFTNGTVDSLTVTNAGGTVHLATTVSLGANYVKKSWSTTGTLTQSGPAAFTVTLGQTPPNNTIAPNPVAGANIAWTPDTAARDLAGNAVRAAAATQTGNGQDF
ncbi:MAG: beta strand repeat-containing protein [Solirubrobacteraceae bacterium]